MHSRICFAWDPWDNWSCLIIGYPQIWWLIISLYKHYISRYTPFFRKKNHCFSASSWVAWIGSSVSHPASTIFLALRAVSRYGWLLPENPLQLPAVTTSSNKVSALRVAQSGPQRGIFQKFPKCAMDFIWIFSQGQRLGACGWQQWGRMKPWNIVIFDIQIL